MPLDDSDRGPSMWKRLLLGAVLVIFASASATAVAAFREVDQVVNALRLQPELKLGGDIAEDRARQAPDDHAAGLGPPAQEQPRGRGRGRPLGHHHPRPAGPQEEGHRIDVAAARPQGADPRPRHRQDQRRLRGGRPAADAEDRQAAHRAAHQPRHQHRLPQLLRGRERPGLHLRRRGPALLQQQRPVRIHQRPRGLPAAVRPRGAPVRALPLRGQRPRPLRPPAGLPAPGQAAGGRGPPGRGPRQAGQDLRQVHLVGHPRPGRGAADRQARRRLHRPAGARGALRGQDRRQLRDRRLEERAQARRAVPRRGGDPGPPRRAQAEGHAQEAQEGRRAATTSRTPRPPGRTRGCRPCSRGSARACRCSIPPSA